MRKQNIMKFLGSIGIIFFLSVFYNPVKAQTPAKNPGEKGNKNPERTDLFKLAG